MGDQPENPYTARTERTADYKYRAVVEFTYQADISDQGRRVAVHVLAGVFLTDEEALAEAIPKSVRAESTQSSRSAGHVDSRVLL